MSHVFISYSKKNKDYARKLADHLIASGFDVWIDDRIDYGSEWEEAIQKAIDACAAFVVIMTPDSRDSKWVKRECQYAESAGKPQFPMLLEGTVFFRYGTAQYVDVTDGLLPPDAFLDEIAENAPRKRGIGADITTQEMGKSTPFQTTDETVGATQESISPPFLQMPPPDSSVLEKGIPDTATAHGTERHGSRRIVYIIGAAVIAALLLVALALILPRSDEGRIEFGQTKVGELTEAAPTQSYTFAGEAGDSIVISLISEEFDPYLLLLDETGNEIASDDDSIGTQDSQIGPFALPSDGNYTIVAQSFAYHNGETPTTGEYTLTLQHFESEAIEDNETEEAHSCQFDWFFGNELALEGDCPISGATEFDGFMQRFGDGVILGIRIPSGQGQVVFLTDEGTFFGGVGEWDLSDAPIGSCAFSSVTGVMNAMPHDGSVDEVVGCPVEEVQLETINLQISDSRYVFYIGTYDGAVYRLAASSSTAEEGEWQQVR